MESVRKRRRLQKQVETTISKNNISEENIKKCFINNDNVKLKTEKTEGSLQHVAYTNDLHSESLMDSMTDDNESQIIMKQEIDIDEETNPQLLVKQPSPQMQFVECDINNEPQSPTSINPQVKQEINEDGLASDNESDEESPGSESAQYVSRSDMILNMEDVDIIEEMDTVDPSLLAADQNLLNGLYTSDVISSDKCEFHWNPLSSTEQPNIKRHEFNYTAGPLKQFFSPYDAFTSIWDRTIMEYIVDETNKYAKHIIPKLPYSVRNTKWTDTNVDELYVFFAVSLALGMCIKKDMSEYWYVRGHLTDTPNFSKAITFNRFLTLSRFFNIANVNSNTNGLSPAQAKVAKIMPVVNHLNKKFQELYELGQDIVIDEPYEKHTRCHSIYKFLIYNDMAGIKTIEISDAKTGYLWKLDITAEQKITSSEVTRGITSSHILKLIDGLQNKGHTIWIDNIFNRPSLARLLKTMGFDFVGTLRAKSKYIPRKFSADELKISRVRGCTSGDINFILWRDHKMVSFISTFHGTQTKEQESKLRPVVFIDFRKCLTGVDRKDQILAVYPIERKLSKVWSNKMFRRFLNISVYNSLILHNTIQHTTQVHRDFRFNLIQELITRHKLQQNLLMSVAQRGPTGRGILPSSYWEHFPEEFGWMCRKKKERIRKACVLCRKRTQTRCPGCNVALCLFTCHRLYHSTVSDK